MTTDVKKIKKDRYQKCENVIVPPVDIFETRDEYVVKADMPGISKEQIDITVEDNILEIYGCLNEAQTEEPSYGEYSLRNYARSFKIDGHIDTGKITAEMDLGVLTLHLPKREELKPKKIEIQLA